MKRVALTIGLSLLIIAGASLAIAQDRGGLRPGRRQGQRLAMGKRPGGDIPMGGKRVTIEAGGLKRTGLLFLPTGDRRQKPPLLIAFHGHGQSGEIMARATGFSKAWPEAIVVFPDGLTGVPGINDTEGSKPGWQKNPGEVNDRDLALFDAIVEKTVAQYNADPEHIYVAGFSNGGRMACLLWSVRADKIRSLASCASQSAGQGMSKSLQPKPAVVIHGQKDAMISVQSSLLDINAILQANHSTEPMTSWPAGIERKHYPMGQGGADTLVITHPGAHLWPDFATPQVVAFFKAHK